MRVLIVTDWNRGRGGAEAYIGWLRDGLRRSGDDVRLLTSDAGTAGDGTADYVVRTTENMAAQAFLQIANPFAVRAMRRALREFDPDVVLVNMFAHHLSPAVLHALAGRPVVLLASDFKIVCPIGSKLLPDGSICTSPAGLICRTSHCVGTAHWIRDLPRYSSIRSGLRNVTNVVACSEWLRRELAQAGVESECIYLPVPGPSAAYRRRAAPAPRFLFCGRLDTEKGVAILMQAFAKVLTEYRDAVLHLAGTGAERLRLEQLARALRIESSTLFLGWLSPAEIEREVSEAWVLVAPSLWAEPLGLVALEAIVRGVPVIATASGGFAETVEQDLSGILVPNGDIDALAAAMMTIASRQSFADHSLPDHVVARIAERHSIEGHIDKMRRVFSRSAQATM